jgi:enoyl-CoA hydratase
VVTLDREDKQNALDLEMIWALEAAAVAIDREEAIRVVVITGAGSKSFCAGGGITAWSKLSPTGFGLGWVRDGHRAFDVLARLRQPLVAVLNGHALGGGLELAATADFRIAEAHVRVGQPEAGLGIIPGWSGTQRAVRRFGAQVVRRMSLAGEVYSAEQALKLGVVDYVVSTGGGMTRARELAADICGRGGRAVSMIRQLINAAEGEDANRAIEAMAGAYVASTDELMEGVTAFREKRKPRFDV